MGYRGRESPLWSDISARLGVVPLPEPIVGVSPAELCLEAFGRYLLEERGLAEGTVVTDVHGCRSVLGYPPRRGSRAGAAHAGRDCRVRPIPVRAA